VLLSRTDLPAAERAQHIRVPHKGRSTVQGDTNHLLDQIALGGLRLYGLTRFGRFASAANDT